MDGENLRAGDGAVCPAALAAWKWPLSFESKGFSPVGFNGVSPPLSGTLYWVRPCTGKVRSFLRT